MLEVTGRKMEEELSHECQTMSALHQPPFSGTVHLLHPVCVCVCVCVCVSEGVYLKFKV